MNRFRVLAIALVLLVIAGGATFFVRSRAPAPKAAEPVKQAEIAEEISIPATLHATQVTQVAVPIEGKVESFDVQVGAEVFQGQLLARIRSQGLEASREAAEIDLERADTRVRTLEAALTAARLEASRASADAARVRNDLDRASKYYQRQKLMFEQGATPRKTFEKAEADFNALEAEATNLIAVSQGAEERISSLSRELDAARKLLEGKSDDVEVAKERIGSGDVLSPVDGIVVAIRGQAGDDVHPTTPDLLQIATDLSSLQAVAEIAPAFAARVKPGMPVAVVIAELGGETLQGAVTKVEDNKITAEFADPNPAVKPGLTAQMRIKLP